MATKNLARTAIEPGRVKQNKEARNRANRAERRLVAAALRSAIDFDAFVFPPRERVPVEQSDNLQPVRRYLRSRIGQLWSNVHSEISARFDRRTTPGRHIMECHILRDVRTVHAVNARFADFLIDDDGVLQIGFRYEGFHNYTKAAERRVSESEINDWLDNRRIGRHGHHLFWFVPTASRTVGVDGIMGFRQHQKLNAHELAFWNTLSSYRHEHILERSPLRHKK